MNKEKISIVIAAVLVFVTVFALSGCYTSKDAVTKVSADEIALQIQRRQQLQFCGCGICAR